jgi:excinuclease ABC subunit A
MIGGDFGGVIMTEYIKIRGARQHNLKNINLDIPKNKLVVFTGLSGSGKSSLAFDTIYAEGQRRYVESLSAYARQFLGIMNKPDVDSIEGLSPAISIDQKSVSHNPRSTVGTITEIYDYLRLLFARIGHPHCPKCGREIQRQSVDQIVTNIFSLINEEMSKLFSTKPVRFALLAPIVKDKRGEFHELFNNLKAKGYTYARIDGHLVDIRKELFIIKTNRHTIDILIDKYSLSKKDLRKKEILNTIKARLTAACEQALNLTAGYAIISFIYDAAFEFPVNPQKYTDHLFSELFACPFDNINLPEVEPRIFSFNSPHGACPNCTGIGSLLKIDPDLIFNKDLTIAEGGILPYSKSLFNDSWWSRTFFQVMTANHINTRIPIKNLSAADLKILLYGTGDKTYEIHGTNRYGRMTVIYESFIGVTHDLESKYTETESDYVRAEIEKYMRQEVCGVCGGKRLKTEALSVTINHKSIVDITDLAIDSCYSWMEDLPVNLDHRENQIASIILKEIKNRLHFLLSVGLEYITLGRGSRTLSGGESQRIRLASQIGSGLSGVLYVLDEPSIGLHSQDTQKLIDTLKKLRDLGNTVVVVEHDREIIEAADTIIDFGPLAGAKGGQIVFNGSVTALKKSPSITGKYLRIPSLTYINRQTSMLEGNLTLTGAQLNNLKNIDVSFPLGKFICVTGVSGSGKSSLVVDTLYHVLMQKFSYNHKEKPGKYSGIEGTELIDKVILVDQSPIGRTPRSNPATYTGLFTYIRELFALLPESKQRGFKSGRFSFNVKGGRCEACLGEGQIKIEMQFLSDVFITCEVCKGRRYNQTTLEVKYQGKNIAEILEMSVSEAVEFFKNFSHIYDKLLTLKQVGLTYMHLGQPATMLSGGEAQRIKLATELSKKQTGKTVYILDEPTTGLHFADLEKLLNVLLQLKEKGNTVIVIEHNLDVIKNADYVIDLGPVGGMKGGYLIGSDTPLGLAKISASVTGKFLRKILK